LELVWLEDFSALAEYGSFVRAAEARHVTQPAFSRRVRALENWMGVELFVRTPQGSLLPLGCEAAPRFGGRCATEREQAPSPQFSL
jgi:DNA-binding transcriptional LysR family regulator